MKTEIFAHTIFGGCAGVSATWKHMEFWSYEDSGAKTVRKIHARFSETEDSAFVDAELSKLLADKIWTPNDTAQGRRANDHE